MTELQVTCRLKYKEPAVRPSIKHVCSISESPCSIPSAHKQVRGYDGFYVNTTLFLNNFYWVFYVFTTMLFLRHLSMYGFGDSWGSWRQFPLYTEWRPYLFFSRDRVFLCNSPGCSRTCFVNQANSEILLPCLPSAGIKGLYHHPPAEPRTSCMPGKHSASEPHPQVVSSSIINVCVVCIQRN